MAPKVAGSWALHRATLDLDLDAFVLFSSAAGVIGNPGQANYAAANSFMDQLARQRRALGLPAQSIAWGAWAGAGMAADLDDRGSGLESRLEGRGAGWLTPREGLLALEELLKAPAAAASPLAASSPLAARVDWAALAERNELLVPMLEEVLPARRRRDLRAQPGSVLQERLAAVPEGGREAVLAAFLQAEMQAILGLSDPPPTDVGFFDLGVDSLMAVDLRGRINRALTGLYSVSNTAVFDYPDVASLAEHLAAGIAATGKVRARPTVRARRARAGDEPIAIVGMACRFPGAPDLGSFWNLLTEGRHAITKVPESRWSDPPDPARFGRAEFPDVCRWGAFIDEIDRFDPGFFRIAPVEARYMDPQQRLLLETSWRGLEDAGIDPATLRGSRSGVYAGIFNSDYQDILFAHGEAGKFRSTAGSAFSASIGRVAFTLGFQGPAIAVDTACSSSLVALHQAVTGLQRGETDLALAGGVNAMLSPLPMAAFSEGNMLAPDGLCKTFDERADGYVRGEGCGMVVLKRLSDAEADGDRIWGLVRGSAVNQDGASAALSAPHGPAQERVIADALERAGVKPGEVDYLEAHGTGTPLGDPIEVEAASATYGVGRDPERPLLLGSVKTNVGHLEAAAGVAGLIKAVLAMKSRFIPRHLHFEAPSRHIEWSALPVRVTSEAGTWPDRNGRMPLAGLSSFGLSGTNSHVILEGYGGADELRESFAVPVGTPVRVTEVDQAARPASAASVAETTRAGGTQVPRLQRLLPLSGATEPALRELAGRYLSWLDDADGLGETRGRDESSESNEADDGAADLLADMAWTASAGRSHFRYRAGVVFQDRDDLARQLEEIARGTRPGIRATGAKPAFLFTGQGSQWVGMGAALYETEPVFRDVLDRLEPVMLELRGESLLEVMFGTRSAGAGPAASAPSPHTTLDDTTWTQPAIYALGCALTELFASAGVVPMAVLGHSVGELAAARAAGAWSLEEGMRLAARRGELMGSLAERGAMAAVFATRADATDMLARFDGVELAADNFTHQVVSGPVGAVEAFSRAIAAEGVRVKPLRTSCAFHSRLMDPILDDLEALGDRMDAQPAHLPLIGNASGRVLRPSETIGGAYLRAHARRPVEFAKSVSALADLGADVLVEIGPHAVLAPMTQAAWSDDGDGPPIVPGMIRDADEGFAHAAAAAYEAGLALNYNGLFAAEERRRIAIPSYPFQRERYWIDPPTCTVKSGVHPLLGVRTDLASGETVFEAEISSDDPDWLADHLLYDTVVAPGAIHATLAAAAAEQLGYSAFEHAVQLHSPMVLGDPARPDEPRQRTVQTILGVPEASGGRAFRVHSRARGGAEESADWVLHAEGTLALEPDGIPFSSDERTDKPALVEGLTEIAPSDHYRTATSVGLALGPSFRTIERLWRDHGESVADVALPEAMEETGMSVHTALLDGCFQCSGAVARDMAERLFTPFAWESFRVNGPLPPRVTCSARLRTTDSAEPRDGDRETVTCDLSLYDAAGSLVGEVVGFSLKRAPRSALFSALEGARGLLHHLEWREQDLIAADAEPVDCESGYWLISGDEDALTEEMARRLSNSGRRVLLIGERATPADATYELAPVDPLGREAWRDLFEERKESGEPLLGVVHVSAHRDEVACDPGESTERSANDPNESANDVLDRTTGATFRALTLIQGLEDANLAPLAGCWLVSRNAQVVDDAGASDLPGSAIWGLGQTVMQEAPHLRCRVVDLNDAGVPNLVDELLSGVHEPAVALRGSKRRIARLGFGLPEPTSPRPEVGIRTDGSYLITGGLGALGLELAQWLVERGAGAVVLTGRSAPDETATSRIAEMQEAGSQVVVQQADITDADAVEALFARIEAELPQLRGVFHCAGTLADAALVNQDEASLKSVLVPKVAGSWLLHRATLNMDLDAFVLFSSVAGVFGSRGQANYAAANAFMDQLARQRNLTGLAGQSIAWGAWSEVGMAARVQRPAAARLEASGVEGFSPRHGMLALESFLERPGVSGLAARVDWKSVAEQNELLAPMLEPVLPLRRTSDGPTHHRSALHERLAAIPEAGRKSVLTAFLQSEMQAILGLSEIPPTDVGFFELGVDSLMAVELRGRINRALESLYSVSNTAVFDHPDIDSLAAHLADGIGTSGKVRAAPAIRTRRAQSTDQPIAITGMACQFPAAPDLAAFWKLLTDQRHAITTVPESRWAEHPDPALYGVSELGEMCRWGAFLDSVDRFDPEFFRIAPVDARYMDPQQRLLLETSWQALEDAGIDPAALRGSRSGVHVGVFTNDYQDVLFAHGEAARFRAAAGSSFSASIGRVAFTLGFEGPAVAVDTACSSSLVALHQAVTGLQRGETDLALAGGVNAMLSPLTMAAFSEGQMLSPDGLCKTFDERANGYVRGEGCGMVVLKRLADAEADGDRIWGLVRGSAVNQDGASAALSVPNGPAQERVILDALDRAGVQPGEVDYLEAHGTGTELGDPIEVHAAAAVYGRDRDEERPLLIGSVKTNVGHLEAAAGMAGLIKAVLAMKSRFIPRHLHFEKPSPHIYWDDLPVRVTAEPAFWPETDDRMPLAGLSSFGISGTNSHVVLEGYGPAAEPREDFAAPVGVPVQAVGTPDVYRRAQRLLPLSGRSEKALQELAALYLTWLDETGATADAPGDGYAPDLPPPDLLADMAWTASTGRSHFRHRAGVVFESREDLVRQLEEIAGGKRPGVRATGSSPAFLFTGQGSQWVGMGVALYETEPVFRDVMDRLEQVVLEMKGKSLLDVMWGTGWRDPASRDPDSPADRPDLDDTAWTQPALYALGCALNELFASVSMTPAAVLGHSVGELVAAHAAGAFSLEDGMRLVVERGALMGSLAEPGVMAAVFATRADVTDALERFDGVELAADNFTHQVVSGPADAVEAFATELSGEGVRVRSLRTSCAFHSRLMDPILDELEALGDDLGAKPSRLPLVGNASGRAMPSSQTIDGPWLRTHARHTVEFAKSVKALAELGADVLVEIGPHAVLAPMAQAAWPRDLDAPPIVAGMARDEQAGFAQVAAAAYEAGLDIDFRGLFAGEERRRISLPSYPFQRERYWIEGTADPARRAGLPVRSDDLERLFYHTAWKEKPLAPGDGPDEPADHKTWLLVANARFQAMPVAEALEARGRNVVLAVQEGAEPGSSAEQVSSDAQCRVVTLDQTSREAWQALIEEISSDGHVSGVVFLAGTDRPSDAASSPPNPSHPSSAPEVALELSTRVLALSQALAGADRRGSGGLTLVTTGGQSIGEERNERIEASSLWGLGRTLALEESALDLRLIDLDWDHEAPAGDAQAAEAADQLAAELMSPDAETQVCWRAGTR